MHKPRLLKNLTPFLLLAGALLIVRPTSAQDLYVGSNSSGQTTNFTSGTNSYNNIYVGYNAGDSNNTLTVANTNTLLQTLGFYTLIGLDGSGNRMVITNGATASGGGLNDYIGYNSDASSNSVLVTGTNSLWSINYDLMVGYAGSASSLVISNGGKVIVGDQTYIGYLAASSNNSVLVTGVGSLLSNTVGLDIGFHGSGSVTVGSGATVAAPSINIAGTGATGTLNIGTLGGSDTNVSVLTTAISLGGNGGATLNLNQKDAFTLTSSISGYSGTLNQLGSGTTILSGSNSYSGGTHINNGTLRTTSTNALWASAVSLTGGALSLQTNLTIASLVWDSSAQITLSNLTKGVYLNDTGTLSLTGSGTNVFNLAGYTYTPLPSSNLTTPFELLSWGVANSYTANNFSVIGATNYTLSINQNSLWFQQNYSDLFVGSNSSVASTNFTSGTNYFGNIYVGYTTTASNNLLTLSNTGTTLSNSAALYVGDNGASNRMVVAGGAVLLTTSNSTIGFSATSSNNSVLVTGSGSTWSNNANLIVGNDGSGNSLVISNGGSASGTGGAGYETVIGMNSDASNNSILVTGTNSFLSNSYNENLIIGNDGSANSLVISNGGGVSALGSIVVGGAAGIVIGLYADASNNSLLVTGTNSYLNGSWLNSGASGSGNRMVISNGAQVTIGASLIGDFATASNNSVLVTGSGSTWSNIFWLAIGQNGSSNSLVIANGGQVSDSVGYIGDSATASNNSVLVTGSGSTWSNSSDLFVGTSGSGNSLVISNGGGVSVTGSSYGTVIGINPGSANNSLLVTGTNSFLSNSLSLYVGMGGSGNSMVISNSAHVVNVMGDIYSSGNSVLVTGLGSIWNNSGNLSVGDSGSGNSLVIANGGQVSDSVGYIGQNLFSMNNSVLVTGSGSTWSNNADLYVGLEGGGTLTIGSGGKVIASSVSIAYYAGSVGTVNFGTYGGSDTNVTLVTPSISFGNASSSTGILNFNQRDTASIATPISGGGSLNQLGSGTTILSGSNSYSGGTLLNAGTVALSNSSALGSGSVTVARNSTIQALTGLGLSNNISIASGATATFDLTTGNTLTNSGVISGSGNVASTNGILNLAGSNSYTGTTLIGSGTLQVTGSGVLAGGSYASAITNNGRLQYGSSASQLLSGVISGSGSLTQNGTGTLALTGSNSYTGTTTVNAGVLLVDNTTGWGVGAGLTVNSNGIVGGSGSIAGAALINGLLDPSRGSSNAMTLTFNTNVTLGATATTMIDLLSVGSYDKIKVGGTLNYGGLLDIVLGNTNALGTYQFFSTLTGGTNITATGSFSTVELTGLFGTWFMTNSSGIWSYANASDSYKFTQASGQFTVTAVPEPSTYAMFGLSALAVVVVMRQSRRGKPDEKRQ